jgi:AraC-like DNA-binding protein
MRTVHYPESAGLKKYIKYISYFEADDDQRELLIFPNAGTAIGLNKDHKFISTEKNTYSTIETPGHHAVLLHINRIDPVRIIDHGKREVITIVFHPFGINHFIRQNLSDLVDANNGDPSFISLVNFSFADFAKNVFEAATITERLQRIEAFLLQKLAPLDIPFMAEAVALLSDMDNIHSIPDICKTIGTSQRNLTRLFNKHICLTPVQFRNVVQFRYSLYKKIEAGEAVNIKDVGYESNYTHSSYMIRMYKKYTGLNPSTFFDKVVMEGNYVFIAL